MLVRIKLYDTKCTVKQWNLQHRMYIFNWTFEKDWNSTSKLKLNCTLCTPLLPSIVLRIVSLTAWLRRIIRVLQSKYTLVYWKLYFWQKNIGWLDFLCIFCQGLGYRERWQNSTEIGYVTEGRLWTDITKSACECNVNTIIIPASRKAQWHNKWAVIPTRW